MSALNHQLSLFSGLEEAGLYHESDSRSFLAICSQDKTGKFHQWCVKPEGLAHYLDFLEPGDRMNVWLSMGEFSRPNRRIVNLSRMGVCFLDLDTYKSPAKNWPRHQVIAKIHDICRDGGIPSPSLIVFSGQGYQIKWLLSSYLPRAALVRWNIVQERLFELFKPLGADASAKDASRLLRLVGSTNLKSGRRVEIVGFHGKSLDTATAFDFELLAKVLMPVGRGNVKSKAQTSLAAPEQRPELKLIACDDNDSAFSKRISTRTLAWDRAEDLRALAQMRGGIGVGMRNTYMLILACQLALSRVIKGSNFKAEARALQLEISNDPKWLKDKDLLKSLHARVVAHYKGVKVEFNGRLKTPIYTYRTASIIKLLDITRDEQKQLKTLICAEEATERNTARERTKRRTAGVVERAEYMEQRKLTATQRREKILAMHAQGLKPMQIMAELNISRAVVTRALSAK